METVNNVAAIDPLETFDNFMKAGIRPAGKRLADKLKWLDDVVCFDGVEQNRASFTVKTASLSVTHNITRNRLYPAGDEKVGRWRYRNGINHVFESIEALEFALNRLKAGLPILF